MNQTHRMFFYTSEQLQGYANNRQIETQGYKIGKVSITSWDTTVK